MGYRVFLCLIAPWFLAWAAFYGYSCITCYITCTTWAALLAQTVKNPPAMQKTRVRSLGREDPLENEWLQYSCLENSVDRGAWWAQTAGHG